METLPTKQENKLPTLSELVSETPETIKQNKLTVLLNQPPPEKWLKSHPTAQIKADNGQSVPLQYLPIDKVEFMLSRIYRRWWVEVRSCGSIANSTWVSVRLYVVNPLTGETEYQDGLGAAPIQTDKGKGAMDWNFAKANGVQIALPAAETYAIKDAAEKLGRIFGRDLARINTMDYASLLIRPQANDTAKDKERERIKQHIGKSKTIKQLSEVSQAIGDDAELNDLYNSKQIELEVTA